MAVLTEPNSTLSISNSNGFNFLVWERLSYTDPRYIITVTCLAFISIIAVYGNLRNLTLIHQCRRLHDVNVLCIANLAFIDFLTGIIAIPLAITVLTLNPLEYPICQFQGCVTLLLYMTSLVATSLISVDRCNAVVNPFGYDSQITASKCVFIVILTWLIPFIIAILPLLGLERYGLGKIYLELLCGISFDYLHENFIISWVMTAFVIINILVIFFSYLIIFTVAYRKTVQDLTRNSKLSRSIRTTSLIVGTNFIFWLPYIIFLGQKFSYNISIPPLPKFSDYFTVIAIIMVMSNPAINPIIYATTNAHLRKHFIRTIPVPQATDQN
ncbi:Adenosine receptor A2a [Trichoplax sp. H2]|nr:Adenosine receptor A2a [Trichoplax sp. H2]|eukprot:RDD38808.1 Adenosine receptor A2a [Trichoplax sp. H2]